MAAPKTPRLPGRNARRRGTRKRQLREAVSQRAPYLPDSYQKARRSYGLFAGLLLAWELIGIELPEAPFSDFRIAFKNPEAAPYVLIALVLYFMFRTTIEWHQADAIRRAMKASKIDFAAAHLLATVALGVFFLQRLLDLQVADLIAENRRFSFLAFFGFVTGATAASLWRTWRLFLGIRWLQFNDILNVMIALASVAALIALAYEASPTGFELVLLGTFIVIGVTSSVIAHRLARRLTKRWLQEQEEAKATTSNNTTLPDAATSSTSPRSESSRKTD